MPISSLVQEDSLEEGMAIQSSILAWRIPWTEEPSRLQSMESETQVPSLNWKDPVQEEMATHSNIVA